MQPGLKPSVRALRGTGWNRPLLAPFDFGLAFAGDAVNDFATVTGYNGAPFWTTGALEMWVRKPSIPVTEQIFHVTDGTYRFTIQVSGSSVGFQCFTPTINTSYSASTASNQSANIQYWVFEWSPTTFFFHVNGGSENQGFSYSVANAGGASAFLTNNLSAMQFFRGFTTTYAAGKHDEIRLYNRRLDADERRLNYNLGIGENPSNTIGLLDRWSFDQLVNTNRVNSTGQNAFQMFLQNVDVNTILQTL
jgi:hypothetical protein